MRSIKARFENIQKKNPDFNTLICFNIATRHRGFKKKKLAENFNKLVDKNNYFKNEKKELISSIVEASKLP